MSTSPPLSPSSALGPTLRSLPLPDASSTTSGTTKAKAAAGGWDATVADRFDFSQMSADARRSCSVSPHAVSHGCSVVGIRRRGGDDHSENGGEAGGDDDDSEHNDPQRQQEEWVAWEANFDHRVGRVASNADGTVVVASTAGGTVSLLRGSDGQVLATRRVYAVGDDDEGEDGEYYICYIVY